MHKTKRAVSKTNNTTFIYRQSRNQELCVVNILNEYIQRILTVRKSSDINQLLLSIIKPDKPVRPTTISNWTKKVLAIAGINIAVYLSFYANKSGGSLVDILKRGNGSKASK